MRFLCEQCKAKYQIADEKVAGKTVRMKCRKCGHLIEVKAEVTETSVSTRAPQPDPPEGLAEREDATRVGMDVGSMMKLSGHKPGAPPRPGAPAAPTAKPLNKPGLATSLASAKPAKPAAPKPESALAGAFQKSTKEDDRAMIEISTSSEWYCAINGVPVGPVRIAELRRKAASGAVHEDSLVWQEGMEEWRPLKTIPELVAIVHEGLSADRPSLVTPQPPQQQQRQSSPPTPAPPAQMRERMKSSPPGALREAPGRSNVIPLAGRLATAEKLEPFSDPFAPPASAPAVAALDMPTTSGVAAPTVVIPRKQGPNWIVIGMVVAFGAFGATAGIAVFFKSAPAQPAPTIYMTAQQQPTGTAAQANNGTNDIGKIEIDPTSPQATVRTGGGVRPTGTTAATSSGKVVDPSIAALLGGPGTGPSIGGNGVGGSASSALSEEAIQRTVQQRSAGVKRTCWERGGGTESNVNVKVHLVIAATGNVQSSSAEGNDPIVSKCIENSVKNWSFPVSSGSTTVDIPFHFLRQ